MWLAVTISFILYIGGFILTHELYQMPIRHTTYVHIIISANYVHFCTVYYRAIAILDVGLASMLLDIPTSNTGMTARKRLYIFR